MQFLIFFWPRPLRSYTLFLIFSLALFRLIQCNVQFLFFFWPCPQRRLSYTLFMIFSFALYRLVQCAVFNLLLAVPSQKAVLHSVPEFQLSTWSTGSNVLHTWLPRLWMPSKRGKAVRPAAQCRWCCCHALQTSADHEVLAALESTRKFLCEFVYVVACLSISEVKKANVH